MLYGHLWLAGMICYGLACILVGIDSVEDIWASEEGIKPTQTAPSAQNRQYDIKQPICVLSQAFLSSGNSLDGHTGTYYKLSELVSHELSHLIGSDTNDRKMGLDSSSTFSTPSTTISYSDTSTNWNNTNMHLVTMDSYSLASSESKSESTQKTTESANLSPIACELHIPQLAENAETSFAADFLGAKIEDQVIATFNTPNSRYAITSSFVLNDGKVAINIKNISGQDLDSEVFSVAIAIFSG